MTGLSTRLLCADRDVMNRVPDVVSPINVATTYRYPDNPDDFILAKDADPASLTTGRPLYSRLSHPNSSKCEAVLGDLLGGHAVVYNSGLSSFFAAITYYNPKTVAIGDGYHGVHGILDILSRNYGVKQVGLEELDKLSAGDMIHIETPENPYAKVHDLAYYVKKAHDVGAFVVCDSTFAPPPLQDPWEFGVDMVMHAGTKYFGGHSDLLAGVLVTKDSKVKTQLVNDRVFLGTNIANLESFLLLRSLRTYEMRIKRQSSSAEKIVNYLDVHRADYPALKVIHHSSLQKDDFVRRQMKGGHSPVFAIELESQEQAKNLPGKLNYFQHSTSLGGVESLIEWRALSDPHARLTLLRVSVGVEDPDDLIADLDQALKATK
ncbi:hypothetical protein FOA43_002578 [Brettanomyces nanus]|uniref:Cystathionine gamma-synthase n=1 Tax=Eeniella nana TaxID=13502 RepID=A0A875S2P8_EENNA|nr:uncharacterized protein FOA43_002578 [Brettanomyces nanus]QPG75228.1 hypothetical protein FOA43_002578 [Brettanomyces nanus]